MLALLDLPKEPKVVPLGMPKVLPVLLVSKPVPPEQKGSERRLVTLVVSGSKSLVDWAAVAMVADILVTLVTLDTVTPTTPAVTTARNLVSNNTYPYFHYVTIIAKEFNPIQ